MVVVQPLSTQPETKLMKLCAEEQRYQYELIGAQVPSACSGYMTFAIWGQRFAQRYRPGKIFPPFGSTHA